MYFYLINYWPMIFLRCTRTFACKKCYNQKQTLINEKDYNEDDENQNKKDAIIVTSRTRTRNN